MLTIRLFCAAGLSTSLTVERLREAAGERGIDVDVAAFPASEAVREAANADCALFGPQAGGHLSGARAQCDNLGVPTSVILALDYGMVNVKWQVSLDRRIGFHRETILPG